MVNKLILLILLLFLYTTNVFAQGIPVEIIREEQRNNIQVEEIEKKKDGSKKTYEINIWIVVFIVGGIIYITFYRNYKKYKR